MIYQNVSIYLLQKCQPFSQFSYVHPKHVTALIRTTYLIRNQNTVVNITI